MKKKFVLAGVFFLVFIMIGIFVKTVDVQMIGPKNSMIGLASVNDKVRNLFTYNDTIYTITKYFGLMTFAVPFVFASIGLLQLIKRKNLMKVDKELFALGGLYIVIGTLYIVFTIVVVNYRPIIMPDETVLEASFPSSHTLMAITVFGSAFMVMDKFVKNEKLAKILKIVSIVMMLIIFVGRLVSGVHWFTDIVASVVLSAVVLLMFSGTVDYLNQ